MKLSYQKESFVKIMSELPPLFLRHYEEVQEDKTFPLEPSWVGYTAMEVQGQLHVLTVRAESKLVGYLFAITVPHLHYASKGISLTDMFYILPEYRTFWSGVTLFRKGEEMVREVGVHKSFIVTKRHLPISIILKRLGYKFVELIHAKVL